MVITNIIVNVLILGSEFRITIILINIILNIKMLFNVLLVLMMITSAMLSSPMNW